MTSEARPREDAVDEVIASSGAEDAGDPQDASPPPAQGGAESSGTGAADDGAPGGPRSTKRRHGRDSADDGNDDPRSRAGSRLSIPLVPALLVLLLLLLGGAGYLWLTRPEASAIRTADYVTALQAARSGVVDFTSFDYLTLDDDIEQIRRVATGDLRDEGIAQLDGRREEITAAEAVVNTEVVGGGVTQADASDATVVLVIQSTQQSTESEQAQVARYRIEVELEKSEDRWLLSGIKGTGVEDE